MPHKHKRKADGDEAQFNLPPSLRAAPLPVSKQRAPNPQFRKKRKIYSGGDYGADDTPKAFARLMAFKARGKGPKGLDDGPKARVKPSRSDKAQVEDRGNGKSHRQKRDQETKNEENVLATDVSQSSPSALKILPGESMSAFSMRVNAALPLAGVSRSSKKIEGISDHRVTKHEKKLKRLQAGWRAEEARIREKEQEDQELAEEEQEELEALWEDKTVDLPVSGQRGKKEKKGKQARKLVAGEIKDREEDPWDALRKKREERKGLHDVVQAPPVFDKVPREIFKVKNGARVNVGNVPNNVGSLRKREELGEERQTIIDTYRRLMEAKRGEK